MRFLGLIAATLTLLLAHPAGAEERILRFASDVAVQPDGDLIVEERIRILSEGDRIRRGIFRDFPTRYKGRTGSTVRVGFTLLETRREGRAEPSVVETIANGVRVRIGSADTLLDPGEHDYVLRYRTTRHVGRFSDYDELYWNVTGNGWDFPIDLAEARITLPSPIALGQRAIYTGPLGSTATGGTVVEERAGSILFRSSAPLAAREGMTVAVAWPKGVIAEPSREARARQWLADFGPPLVGVAGLLGLLLYYLVAWRRVGRDPMAGTVVPIFAPPDGLSPAAMRYVWKMKTDNRAFAAALVDLGVKGHVRLVEEDGGLLSSDKMRIERLTSAPEPGSAAETAMLDALAEPGGSISMDNEHHAKFSAAREALDESLKKEHEGKMFVRNSGWAVAGVMLLVIAIWLVAATVIASGDGGGLRMVILGIGAMTVAALLFLAGRRSGGGGQCLLSGLAFLLAMGGFAVSVPVIPAALSTGWVWPLLIPALALPLALSAFWWISAPTREGRAVLDRIAGFRHYLSIAERDRLDRMTAPADTLDRFERYLPYAIALGVETRWAERFQSQLTAAAVAQGASQHFGWYSGSHGPWDDAGGFADRMGSSLSSGLSSASTAPGSSSGSGGGGSSGGGGGGGGGGGW